MNKVTYPMICLLGGLLFLSAAPVLWASSDPLPNAGPSAAIKPGYEELYYEQNCVPREEGEIDICSWHFYRDGRGPLLKQQQYLDYEAKFSNLPQPSIKDDELEQYKIKADNGDISAIFELYRYYKNPDSPGFSDFEDDAYAWLLKAVRLGSKEAILEMGLAAPYARETSVQHGGLSASIITNCEGIEGYKTNCFFYNLKIGAPGPKQRFYYIVDVDYKTADSVKPRQLNIIKSNNDLILELVSYNDRQTELRKDYFNQGGEYLGSNREEARPDYFRNFEGYSPIFKPAVWREARGSRRPAEAEINYFPAYERLALENYKRSVLTKSKFNPSFSLIQGNAYGFIVDTKDIPPQNYENEPARRPYLSLDAAELEKAVAEFKWVNGYDPALMSNIIYYGNLYEYINNAKDGDEYAYRLLRELWKNPYSFVYKKPFPAELYELKRLYDFDLAQSGCEIKSVGAPYIASNNSILDGNDEVKILALCDAVDINGSHYDYLDQADNCYALQVQIPTENGPKYHYITADIFSNVYHKRQKIEFRQMNIKRCSSNGAKWWALSITSGGWAPHIKLYFNEHADYIFSEAHVASAKYMLKSAQPSPQPSFERPSKNPEEKNSRCETVYIFNKPTWEDLKSMAKKE